jgi:hypothetical protein
MKEKEMEYERIVEFVDAMKRVVLESENLLDRLEEDTDSNLRWIDEKNSLEENIREARALLWPPELREEEELDDEPE